MIPLAVKITSPEGETYNMPRVALADAFAYQRRFKCKVTDLVSEGGGIDAEHLGYVAWCWLKRNEHIDPEALTFDAFMTGGWDTEIEDEDDQTEDLDEGKAGPRQD